MTNTEPMDDSISLTEHFERMMNAAANYIEPTAYIARHPADQFSKEFPEPKEYDSSTNVERKNRRRDKAFIRDMIYMLDGPEQRAALSRPAPSEASGDVVEAHHVEAALATFDGGLIRQNDERNSRGYTTHYHPKDSMRAVLEQFLASRTQAPQADALREEDDSDVWYSYNQLEERALSMAQTIRGSSEPVLPYSYENEWPRYPQVSGEGNGQPVYLRKDATDPHEPWGYLSSGDETSIQHAVEEYNKRRLPEMVAELEARFGHETLTESQTDAD